MELAIPQISCCEIPSFLRDFEELAAISLCHDDFEQNSEKFRKLLDKINPDGYWSILIEKFYKRIMKRNLSFFNFLNFNSANKTTNSSIRKDVRRSTEKDFDFNDDRELSLSEKLAHFIENDDNDSFKAEFEERVPKENNESFNFLVDLTVIKENMELFRYLLMNGLKPTEKACKLAVISGNLDIISILNELEFSFTPYLTTAIKYHHNEIADWIISNSTKINISSLICLKCFNVRAYTFCIMNNIDDSFGYLLKNKLFKIADFAIEKGLKIDQYYEKCLRLDYLKGIEYFIKNHKPSNESIADLVERGKFDIIKYLMNNEEIRNEKNLKIMMTKAMQIQSIDMMKLLLEYSYDFEVNSLLFKAIDYNVSNEIIDLLIYNSYKSVLHEKENNKLMKYAIEKGNSYIVEYLYLNGVPIQTKDRKPPVIYAIEAKSGKLTEFLSIIGYQISNDIEYNGMTLLDYGINSGSDEVMQFLILHGIDILQKSLRYPKPLCSIFKNFSVETINLISDNYEDFEEIDSDGNTPLILALKTINKSKTIEINAEQTITNIVEQCHNINSKNKEGFTALNYAFQSNNFELVNILLENGADPKICPPILVPYTKRYYGSPNYVHESLIVIAIKKGSDILVNKILDRKCDISIKTEIENETPLMLACQYCSPEIVSRMISICSNVDECNNASLTALSYAIKRKSLEIIKILHDANITKYSASEYVYFDEKESDFNKFIKIYVSDQSRARFTTAIQQIVNVKQFTIKKENNIVDVIEENISKPLQSLIDASQRLIPKETLRRKKKKPSDEMASKERPQGGPIKKVIRRKYYEDSDGDSFVDLF